jgi:hypothetical protein
MFLGRARIICSHSRYDAGDDLHGGACRPAEADKQSGGRACGLVENNAEDGQYGRRRGEESAGRTQQFHRIPTGTRPVPKRQVHIVISRNVGQIDPEIEASGPIKHHGQHSTRRADQVDLGLSHVRDNEQSARGPGQGEPGPFQHVCPPAEGGAGIP